MLLIGASYYNCVAIFCWGFLLYHDKRSHLIAVFSLQVPDLCHRYTDGDELGRGGAASHMVEHCIKVFDDFSANPAEMLLKQHDGSYFTSVPTDVWSVLNQHLSLADLTVSWNAADFIVLSIVRCGLILRMGLHLCLLIAVAVYKSSIMLLEHPPGCKSILQSLILLNTKSL